MRRLAVLIDGLPPDSALRRNGSMWSQENELVATLIDRQEVWLSQLAASWATKGTKLEPPIQITHPDRLGTGAATGSAKASPAEVAERFKRARGR